MPDLQLDGATNDEMGDLTANRKRDAMSQGQKKQRKAGISRAGG